MADAAERKRQQRARAAANGMCIACTKRKPRAGKATCKPCAEASAERIKRMRAEGSL